jgi:hypothetical protein
MAMDPDIGINESDRICYILQLTLLQGRPLQVLGTRVFL